MAFLVGFILLVLVVGFLIFHFIEPIEEFLAKTLGTERRVPPSDERDPLTAKGDTQLDLIDLVKKKDLMGIRALLERGPGAEVLNETDGASGNTALHLIAMQGHYKWPPKGIPTLLLDHGIDVDKKNGLGQTPLVISLLRGWQKIATLLLDRGADRTAVTAAVKHRITCPDCSRVVRKYGL